MTKGSTCAMHEEVKSSMKMEIGCTLKEVIVQARDERRITCGLYESGLILEMNPDSVMLCILPLNQTDDISLDIHYTLIEAFCLENEIALVKVDSEVKLRTLLDEDRTSKQPTQTDTEEKQHMSNDFNCVLVEYSTSECTEFEGDILQFFKETCDMVPEPIVELFI